MWYAICPLLTKNTGKKLRHYATGADTGPERAVPFDNARLVMWGKIVAFGGTILTGFTIAKLGIFLLLAVIQLYRAIEEEEVLEETIPEYSVYKAATKRFIPRLV